MKRSISSILIERLIALTPTKRKLTNVEVFAKEIQDMLEKGEEPYQLKYRRFSVDVKKDIFKGMDYYILNSMHRENKNKIMYFHGGAYISQPVSLHWRLLNAIAKDTKTEIWVPIYPKIPYYNAGDVYQLITELYIRFSNTIQTGKIILMGDSAGGGLVLGLAQRLRDMPVKQPGELIMISPWLDLTMSAPDIMKIEPKDVMLGSNGLRICGELWAGDQDVTDKWISPLYGELNGLGKMTVFTGTHDILNCDAHNLKIKANEQNTIIDFNEKECLGHVYPLLPIGEAQEAIQKIENIVMEKGI